MGWKKIRIAKLLFKINMIIIMLSAYTICIKKNNKLKKILTVLHKYKILKVGTYILITPGIV